MQIISFKWSLVLVLLTASIAWSAETPNWPRWRGPNDDGSAAPGDYPVQLDENAVLWRTPLPGKGSSTPIVWQRMIYVTAPVDGRDALHAVDWSGKVRWSTTFGQESAGKHRNGSGCNASPATDGSALFVYYKSGTLAAVEMDGTIRWQKNLVERFGEDKRFWDHGTSPVLTEKCVVMARMHAGDSWVAAFDKLTGALTWKVARNYSTPLESDQCYTTPLVIRRNGREELLVWGTLHLTIHDVADGHVVWSCGGFNPDSQKLWPAITTPVIVGDMAVICYGRNDRRQPRLHGIRLDGSGDVTKTNRVWLRQDISSFVPSPVAYQGRVYLVRDRGEVECIDPATGKSIWHAAFPKSRASFYASPIIANDVLYAVREDGVALVASIANDRFTLLSQFSLNEPAIGSPLAVGNRLFMRGNEHLFCFQKPSF